MAFLLSLLRKDLILAASGMMMFWKRLTWDLRTLLVAVMELVITIMLWVSLFFMAGMRPMQIAINSALMDIMFIVWIWNCSVMELSFQIWAIADATLDFLTPPLAITAALWGEICGWQKTLLRFWICLWRSLSEEEEGNPTREIINYSQTRRKKKIKGIETFSNFSKAFIEILDEAFKFCLLFCSEVRCREFVRGMILDMRGI